MSDRRPAASDDDAPRPARRRARTSAPIRSIAQVSEADHASRRPSRPSASGRKPCGSRTATSAVRRQRRAARRRPGPAPSASTSASSSRVGAWTRA
ncbi:MAG: hypothetical protein MZV64_04610 [Ignavibacteriales bacterium]|nr:hypothetical protein [Ignavibacteriales bacterium]